MVLGPLICMVRTKIFLVRTKIFLVMPMIFLGSPQILGGHWSEYIRAGFSHFGTAHC